MTPTPSIHSPASPTQAGIAPPLAGVVNRLASGNAPVRIVGFGDSITGVYYHTGGRRAWCDMLETALRQTYPQATLELHNAGVSGNTAAAGLARLDRDVLAHKPHLVVVMFGMNDCAAANPSGFQHSLKTIVQQLEPRLRCRAMGYDRDSALGDPLNADRRRIPAHRSCPANHRRQRHRLYCAPGPGYLYAADNSATLDGGTP